MSFETIPQAPRYELSNLGVLRNRETGKILKWTQLPGRNKMATLYWNGKKICVSLPHLLWQLHGQITSKKAPVPVVISKGARSLRFDSLKECSLYLVRYHGLSAGSCWSKLQRRYKVIGDWNVRYLR